MTSGTRMSAAMEQEFWEMKRKLESIEKAVNCVMCKKMRPIMYICSKCSRSTCITCINLSLKCCVGHKQTIMNTALNEVAKILSNGCKPIQCPFSKCGLIKLKAFMEHVRVKHAGMNQSNNSNSCERTFLLSANDDYGPFRAVDPTIFHYDEYAFLGYVTLANNKATFNLVMIGIKGLANLYAGKIYINRNEVGKSNKYDTDVKAASAGCVHPQDLSQIKSSQTTVDLDALKSIALSVTEGIYEFKVTYSVNKKGKKLKFSPEVKVVQL